MNDTPARPNVLTASILALGPACAVGLVGCSQGGSSPAVGSSGVVGSVATKPGGGSYVVDPNRGGAGQAVGISQLFWGRLVDVYETDATTGETRRVFSEFVVGEDVDSDGVDFELERDPLTEVERLIVLHELGTPGWDAALVRMKATLQPISPKGISINEAPPFSTMPRNAVLVVAFDDLLDPATVDDDTVRILTGSPPTSVLEARVFADVNHGDVADYDGFAGVEFYPTRVIIDPQVTELEATQAGLPVNGLGLPASSSGGQANVVVRIPTVVSAIFNQPKVLSNPTAHPVAFVGNGPVDLGSPTGDVVRAFRSGNATDAFNGFLRDLTPPDLVGTLDAFVDDIQPVAGTTDEFTLDLTFTDATCAVSARAGDVLRATGLFAEVVAPQALAPPTRLFALHVRALAGTPVIGAVDYRTCFQPGVSVPACFLQFKPGAALPPGAGVPVDAAVGIRFNEPMDPASIRAFDSFRIERSAVPANPMERMIVGSVVPSSDARDFQFTPAIDFAHVQGQTESYVVTLTNAISDLAGNAPAALPGPVSFQIDAGAPTRDTGGLVALFDVTDEDDVPGPEWRGNMVFEPGSGIVRPRPVSRFSSVVDTQVGHIALMGAGAVPVPQPLVKEGSRTMQVWRHIDMSLGLLDEGTFDIDVEGLNWAPFGGALSFDSFPSFRIALSHSAFLPDEVLSGTVAAYPASGLINNFEANLLDPVADPLSVVHPDSSPYTIQALDTFPTATGLTVTPYPLNQNVPMDQFSYYTWRDTSIAAVGGPAGNGADPDALFVGLGATPPGTKTYPAGSVPSIGLPLLMEFRCRPDTTAFGLNGFNTVLPTPIPTAIGPNFRVHASGGVNAQGQTQTVDPDTTTVAQTGNKTFYLGQADFVVRVSRVHSRWFDTGAPAGATFVEPVLDLADLPIGTEVSLDFRGATSVSPADDSGGGSAANLGAYGNPGPTAANPMGGYSVQFLDPSGVFVDTIQQVDGGTFFQVRITFVSNAETGLVPRLSGLGFAYER